MMAKNLSLLIILFFIVASCSQQETSTQRPDEYVFNKKPLLKNQYARLPLGDVKPRGWLKNQMQRMANGMTGNLDQIYPLVGESNAWHGGNGDAWERGPYWLDGLVPLAHMLEDSALIQKYKPYVEWTLKSQQDSGYFGPSPADEWEPEPGYQKSNRADWWPRMVVLKVLQQHYEATGDERVIPFMKNYFKYQQEKLPEQPLDNWTLWGGARGMENQNSIYWLYNRTGDEFLLDLAQTVYGQTLDWTGDFTDGKDDHSYDATHSVNVAMGYKQPAVQYMQKQDQKYLEALNDGYKYLMEQHGQPSGMFTGDELLHGRRYSQGTELCTIVEFMYSLETISRVTENTKYMDHLEKVAYNALPAHVRHDQSCRQYFQQANQVQITREQRNFITNHSNTDLLFGTLTGYPCCTTNMHQGWPKFVRNTWLATRDGGLAALIYGPSEVTAKVRGGQQVSIVEETNYPFEEEIKLKISTDGSVEFPLHLRIPGWAEGASISVNGESISAREAGSIQVLERTWNDGDTVKLTFDMNVNIERGYEQAAFVERGPLVYVNALEENWNKYPEQKLPELKKGLAYEVTSREDWNYGLVVNPNNPDESFQFSRSESFPANPWNRENVPVQMRATAKQIPYWGLYNGSAGPIPFSPVDEVSTSSRKLKLIPYGSSVLRISAFPVIRD